jgi:uncharacterized membrane protein YdfJ with MMPL/SSD domain
MEEDKTQDSGADAYSLVSETLFTVIALSSMLIAAAAIAMIVLFIDDKALKIVAIILIIAVYHLLTRVLHHLNQLVKSRFKSH